MKSILITLLLLTSTLYGHSCATLLEEYNAVERTWSQSYTEQTFLNNERERLNSIIIEAQRTQEILKHAIVLYGDRHFTKRELSTLNARMQRGQITPEAMFVMKGIRPLGLLEGQNALKHMLQWSRESLVEIDAKAHTLSQRIDTLHAKLESLSKALLHNHCDTSPPKLTAQSSQDEDDIMQRLRDKELQRQAEVSNRRWSDIERVWIEEHYRCRYPHCNNNAPHMH